MTKKINETEQEVAETKLTSGPSLSKLLSECTFIDKPERPAYKCFRGFPDKGYKGSTLQKYEKVIGKTLCGHNHPAFDYCPYKDKS